MPPSSLSGTARAEHTARAGIRLDPVLVAVACAMLGATLAVAPAPGLTAFGAGLLALGRRLGARLLVAAVLAAGLGWARASAELAAHARASEAARAFLQGPARCAGSGHVTSSPVRRGPNLRVDAELTALDCDGRTSTRQWPVRLYVPASSAPPLERGNRISVVADLAPTSDFHNLGLADPRPAAARRGAVLSGGAVLVELERRAVSGRALIDRARAHVRERISATFAPSVSGLARALVLGESDLDPEDERAFQRSGLSHLLAVSGTHLVLAVLALVRGLEALARRAESLSVRSDVRRPAAVVGLCLAPLYADFAGGSGSAWRAAWMLCAVLGVRALGRHAFPSRVLALSLAGGWLGDGHALFDPSFTLSVGATTGLLVFGQSREEHQLASLTEPRPPELARLARSVSRAALTTLAATAPCVPLLLSISPGLSLASIGANLLAAPLGEAVALPLCLCHALCWPFPALEHGVALVATGALALIRGIAWASASVDWLYVEVPPPNAWHLAVLAAAVPLTAFPHARPWLDPAPPSPPLPPPPLPPAPLPAQPSRLEPASLGRQTLSLRHPGDALPAAASWSRTWVSAVAADPPPARPHGAPVHGIPSQRPGGTGPGARTRAARASCAAALLCVLALVLVEAATRWQHSATRQRALQLLRVTALDVGQGDATLVDLPDGRLMLIDGGGNVGVPVDPGERVIVPLLRARRRSRVDILVLTHPHPDHLGGLLAVARELSIGELWYGGAPAPAGSNYERLLALLRGRSVPLRGAAELCAAGALPLARVASDTLEVLHPCPLDPAHSLNDNSLVLRITHGQHAALFMGDAEHWAEQRLLATHPAELAADLLKVGHHGSRTSSSPTLLASIHPRLATLSSGTRNRFGHPHPETLHHLREAGALPLRLDQLGSVQWQTDGNEQRLTAWAASALLTQTHRASSASGIAPG